MLTFENYLTDIPFLIAGIPLTIGISIGAFICGVIISLPMAVIRILKTPFINQIILGWIEFFRTTPPLVHIVWIYYVFPVAFDLRFSALTVVILALSANTSAQMAEIFRAGIQSISRGQTEAGTVLGLNYVQRLFYIILPQAVRLIMAPSANTLVSTYTSGIFITFLVWATYAETFERFFSSLSSYKGTGGRAAFSPDVPP